MLWLVIGWITRLGRILCIGGLFGEDKSAGDQVVQGLFPLRKESHDVADQKPTAETSFDYEAGGCPSNGNPGAI